MGTYFIGLLLFSMWYICKVRNRLDFERVSPELRQVVCLAFERLDEFSTLATPSVLPKPLPLVNSNAKVPSPRWALPPIGYYKINLDGAFYSRTWAGCN